MQKATNKTKVSEKNNNKNNSFLRAKLYKSGKIVCFACDTFFPSKIFSLKKKKTDLKLSR